MHHRHSGQSLVEFALILPLFILIIAGLFDFGRAFYALITITNAAREGARYATLHPKYNDALGHPNFYQIVEFTKDETTGSLVNLHSSKAVVSATCPDIDLDFICDRFQPVTISISYNYSDEMLFRFFFPSGIQMHREVEMQIP